MSIRELNTYLIVKRVNSLPIYSTLPNLVAKIITNIYQL